MLTVSICRTLARNLRLYRNAAAGARKYVGDIPDGLEYYVLGSTTASCAYDFQAVGGNGFNGAVAPQTVSYDYRLLEQYHTKIKKGGTVIWSPCVFSLCVPEYEKTRMHLRYCYVFEKANIYRANGLTEILAAVYPIICLAALPVRRYAFPIARRIKHKLLGNGKSVPMDAASRLAASAEGSCRGWEKEFMLNDMHVSALSDMKRRMEYCLSYLRKIKKLCEENQLNFVIVIPPVSRAMLARLRRDDLERFLLRPIEESGESFRIWNYFDDKFFSDDKFFDTAICMNDTGRRLFTKEVIKRIGAEIL